MQAPTPPYPWAREILRGCKGKMNESGTAKFGSSDASAKSCGNDFIAACNLSEMVSGLPNGYVTAIKAIRKEGEWLLIVNVDDNGQSLVGFRGFDEIIELPRALHKLLTNGKWRENRPWEPIDK